MATGVPKKNVVQRCARPITLEYAGKRSVAEILATPPAHLTRIGRHSSKNRLIFGENLGVLSALARDEEVAGKVVLVYIDPPFATQSAFHSRELDHAYEDTLAGPAFIEFLRERLILLYRLLANNGSLYLHLDQRMAFHARVILDEIFGEGGFRNFITRKKCSHKNYTRNAYGNISDYILFYTKTDAYTWHRPMEGWTDARAAKEYEYVEGSTGRRYKKVPIHAPGVRNGETGKLWRGMLPPPGKHWQYTPARLDELDASGEIYWSGNGNPRRKVYLDQSAGVPVQDVWMDVRDAHNQNTHITGYPTEKPAELLGRIVGASSDPGDLVLDCFAGSGTTLAVAHELGRRWIGVDDSPEAMRTTLKRFAYGMEPMGDFVNKREQEVPQVSLFEGVDQPPAKSHKPIDDFSAYAERGRVDELKALLDLDKPKRFLESEARESG